MLTHASDQGTVYVVKAPGEELTGLSGPVPIQVTHELHQHPLAPVVRTVARIYDQPERPLAFESFINVDEEDQRADFARLAEQEELLFVFYDEVLSHRLTKRVRNSAGGEMSQILSYADRVRAAIPDERYDFDRAKATVMATTRL
ncbi:MAG: hypothetical protein JOZ41_11760 [Chloroflexi bacterium]|nr:hypothetical protein [Chloroflexota bacterium]